MTRAETVRQSHASDQLRLRQPTADDGRAVHELIASCPPLDRNSLYCNLLQCSHFADTCVLAEQADTEADTEADTGAATLAGFISAYRLPRRAETLFVWQVAVAAHARGRGLARRMLLELLERVECADIDTIETTITPGNDASWSLFESLARALSAPLTREPLFERERHFRGEHDSEVLVRIGPFARAKQSADHRRRTA